MKHWIFLLPKGAVPVRNPATMAPFEDFRTGLTAVSERKDWVPGVLRDTSLTPDQRRTILATGAAKVLPHLPYSEAVLGALAGGTICMLGEVPLPFWPRYTAPDYARLLRCGSAYHRPHRDTNRPAAAGTGPGDAGAHQHVVPVRAWRHPAGFCPGGGTVRHEAKQALLPQPRHVSGGLGPGVCHRFLLQRNARRWRPCSAR